MDNNVKKLMIINPEVLRIAKAIYKGGKFEFSTDSAFDFRRFFEQGLKHYE